MDLRNRLGLYGAYFFGMAAIGFTLPYLPLYLSEKGLSDRAIGLVSTVAALVSLAQFPIGIWSDRLGSRKPFLLAALALITLATALLPSAYSVMWLGFLVVLFAENGICRAVVESLSGAEATSVAAEGKVGSALGALRFWRPAGIVLVALGSGWLVERRGIDVVLPLLVVLQGLAFCAALLLHGDRGKTSRVRAQKPRPQGGRPGWLTKDPTLWTFVAAMVLFHVANAPAGLYLGLFMKRTLDAPESVLGYAFAMSMVFWVLVVWPAGRLADRWGRRPLLIACWGVMALRLAAVAVAQTPWQVVAAQSLDGVANGMFAVLAAAWMIDRLADSRRTGEAQVIVGCSLVLGSAIGPALSGLLVEALGYRALFGLLAAIGAFATIVVIAFVPETLGSRPRAAA